MVAGMFVAHTVHDLLSEQGQNSWFPCKVMDSLQRHDLGVYNGASMKGVTRNGRSLLVIQWGSAHCRRSRWIPGFSEFPIFLKMWIFRIFRYRSQYFNTISENLDKFLQFLKNPRNSYQFSSSLNINIVKFAEKMRFFEKNRKNDKILDEFLLKFWGLSGAKVWWSCRSRKMLKNAPILAIWGVDTAENEPFS